MKGTLYAQSLDVLENRKVDILAVDENNQPTIVSTKYGNGEALLAGTYLGMASFQQNDANNDKFYSNLLNWAKISRPFTTSLDGRMSDQVEVRLQDKADGGFMLFIINHSNKTENIDVNLAVKTKGAFHVKNIIEDTQTALRSADNVLKINRVIQSKDVHVLEVTASRQ